VLRIISKPAQFGKRDRQPLWENFQHIFFHLKNIKNIINGCIRSHAPNIGGCEAEMSEIFAVDEGGVLAEGGVQYSNGSSTLKNGT
jgi:hypothetical protein